LKTKISTKYSRAHHGTQRLPTQLYELTQSAPVVQVLGQAKDDWYEKTMRSLAIYPVLCLQSDFKYNKWFQMSQKNMAKMAGVTVNTVASGIEDLEKRVLGNEPYDEPFLEKKKRTDGQRHFYEYKVYYIRLDDIKESRGEYFTFYKCIIESGVWANLKPRAKALYISMRRNSHFDFDIYAEIESYFYYYEGYELD